MNFEEIDFYVFYVNYLSKKEYENKKVLVGYNEIDGKEVTMSKFKEDINQTIILYLIIRAIKNGILYFIPREECYVEEKKLIYKRILFNKLILKEIKVPLLDIQDIIDKGSKIPKAYANSSNPLNYITIFFKPYERILIKMKSGKEYKIFVDADPYTFRNDDDNKFIRTYNKLKEMVIEEQSKLSFNKKI